MTEAEYKDKVFQMAQDNHIWLNSFDCIRPTPEFCESLGRSIIEKLKQKENLLPSWYGESEKFDMISELTPVMYLSINKS